MLVMGGKLLLAEVSLASLHTLALPPYTLAEVSLASLNTHTRARARCAWRHVVTFHQFSITRLKPQRKVAIT